MNKPPACYKCHTRTAHPWHDNGTENLFHSWMWEIDGPKASPVFYIERNGFS